MPARLYFYPRSPCGERLNCTSIGRPKRLYFYPRSPCGERQVTQTCRAKISDFYPRSPCGERRLNLPSRPIDRNISIHALLAESDADRDADWVRVYVFLSTLSLRRATPRGDSCYLDNIISIHALLAESDPKLLAISVFIHTFLSTLSLRRATGGVRPSCFGRIIFLSTLSLRRATPKIR